MTSTELVNVFRHTMEVFDTNPELSQSTEEVCRNTLFYEEGFLSSRGPRENREGIVSVVSATTFRCAHSFAGSGKIAALNFANPFEPGGGVARGARAQEECLCRCSNLYRSLTTPEAAEKYYRPNAEQKNNYLFSDRIIYSPGVTVIKADGTYEMLPDPFRVDVITCAAPYNGYKHEPDELKSTYLKRLTIIFETAVENGVDILILGAFGCGAFYIPPRLMAESFRELIEAKYRRYFDRICFAIPAASPADRNFAAFMEVLGNT